MMHGRKNIKKKQFLLWYIRNDFVGSIASYSKELGQTVENK